MPRFLTRPRPTLGSPTPAVSPSISCSSFLPHDSSAECPATASTDYFQDGAADNGGPSLLPSTCPESISHPDTVSNPPSYLSHSPPPLLSPRSGHPSGPVMTCVHRCPPSILDHMAIPFTDPVSSISGRNSRASNVSGMTGTSQPPRPPPQAGVSSETMSNAGVLSMLKTSTDTGDIGALSFNSSRLPSMPRPTHQRRSHSSHPPGSMNPHNSVSSLSYHRYAPSQASRVSSQWEAMPTHRRGSLASMRSMPPTLAQTQQQLGQVTPRMPRPAATGSRDSRSYSLTSTLPGLPLPSYRSANSLKGRVHDPRLLAHAPSEQFPVMPDSRSPLLYPTRLRRPGFRSPSPALSEMHQSGMPTQTGQTPVNRRAPMPQHVQLPSQTMRRGPDDIYALEPRHLSARPPPVTARPSPGARFDPTQLPHRPAAMRRPPPPIALIQQSSSPSGQSGQYKGLASSNSVTYGAPRSNISPKSSSSGRPSKPSLQYQEFRGPHAPPNVAPRVHYMFHNAARHARDLPQRSETPVTDMAAPSSDPPSSRSVPSSSNPPTPRDHTNIEAMIDPAFNDPASADLSESPSGPVYSARYFDYVEGIDKPIDESDSDVPHPSVPQSGFVQRVKAMLESKAVGESRLDIEPSQPAEEVHELAVESSDIEASESQVHELAANETPRFTLVEEFIAPSELPASPVRPTETHTMRSNGEQGTQHITREIIKAELGPSSADDTTIHHEGEENPHIVITAGRERRARRPTGEVDGRHLMAPNDDDSVSITSTTDSGQAISKSDNESSSTISVRASLPSGADYALRFTVHLDSTRTSSAETYSKDHFGLDVESVRQRQSDICSSKNRKTPVLRDTMATQPDKGPDEPVSPLKSEHHDVSRDSAVSPMQTQTLGIDETLHVSAEHNIERHSAEQPSIPGSFPVDRSPPTTPRAPKTHAKSIQLPPSSTTATDTNSTNRYSLPGDLSSIGDTTTNTTTDMITDVAVRFSLPQTTTTSAKAQIVDVASSPAPFKSTDESTPTSDACQRGTRAPARNSVTFADEVAPLAVSKRSDPLTSTPKNTEPPTFTKSKSIIRKPPPRGKQQESERTSLDSTTDLRIPNVSNANGIHSRFGNKFLPDLKEESVEDMSVTDPRRSSGAIREPRFPLPDRVTAVKAIQDNRLQESGERAQARRTLRHRHKTLAGIRDLPSLNFSQMDLVDKLNEALDVRTTRSLDVDRHHDLPNIVCPSPQRPQSTEPFRERYTSFFTKPEPFTMESLRIGDAQVEEQRPLEDNGTLAVDVQEHSDEEDEPVIRTLSPETFLNFAREVNRLSIPSVAGLSERLSELIPGLRNLNSLQLDSLLGPWSDNGSLNDNELVRPGTVLSNRTSTAFRALAERAEEIVRNGTHDSAQSTKPLALNKALPMLPESASASNLVAGDTTDVKQSYLSGSVSVPTDLGKDVARPPSAVVRDKTPTTEEEVRELLPPGMNPIARATRRSLTVSQASTRPWNLDENYPWATDKMDVDLVVPQRARLVGSSPKAGGQEKSMTKSPGLSADAGATSTIKGIDIGSIIDPNDSRGSVTTEQLTGVDSAQPRKSSKRSIIGSITRKLGFSDHHTGDEESTTQTLTTYLQPTDSATHTSCQSGDRYPTSGLSPPDAFNLDEVRSFFSDNSSEGGGGRTPSLRMRLAQLKGKRKTVRIRAPDSLSEGSSAHHGYPHHPSHHQQSQSHHHHYHHHQHHHEQLRTGHDGMNAPLSPQCHHEMPSSIVVTTAPPYHGAAGVGMSKTEFHLKRFGEKLRHLLLRGGELFRIWSGARRSHPRTTRAGGQQARLSPRVLSPHVSSPRVPEAGREDWLGDEELS